MSSFIYILLFITISTTFGQNMKKVSVAVYYESLCPDSIKFYNEQLYPAWNSPLKAYMNLVLIPYGKATTTLDNGTYTFSCHHGEKECYGNKVQACSLKKLDMDTSVKYVNCLMRMAKESKDNEYPTKSCGNELRIPTDPLNSIVHCANTTEGNEYLAELGNKTMKFQNPLTSVPTVVFNNHPDGKNKEATSNFKSVLCSYIEGTKPDECIKSGSSALFPTALLFIIALIVSMQRL